MRAVVCGWKMTKSLKYQGSGRFWLNHLSRILAEGKNLIKGDQISPGGTCWELRNLSRCGGWGILVKMT